MADTALHPNWEIIAQARLATLTAQWESDNERRFDNRACCETGHRSRADGREAVGHLVDRLVRPGIDDR
jgi:hypothetical protein